jgi:hypothetical protein
MVASPCLNTLTANTRVYERCDMKQGDVFDINVPI